MKPIHLLAAVSLVVVAMQFVPVERDNPPVLSDLGAPEPAASVLRRACYDCHSNETRWPWYARVAPVSWLVAHDVEEGREHLNFSDWGGYDPQERADLGAEAWEEVEEGEMPPWFYVLLHPDVELSESDREVLRTWSRTIAPAKAETDAS